MDEKLLIEILGKMLDERDRRLEERFDERDRRLEERFDERDRRLEERFDKLESNFKDFTVSTNERFEKLEANLKDFIVRNNVAIGEVLTSALEDTREHVKKVELVTKNNLYDIAVLKGELKQG